MVPNRIGSMNFSELNVNCSGRSSVEPVFTCSFKLIFATKNFSPWRMYGCKALDAPFGMRYLFKCSQRSRPPDSLADRITMSYSPTVYCASIFTPSALAASILLLGAMAAGAGARCIIISRRSWHGSGSKYSASRGAVYASIRSKIFLSMTLIWSFFKTSGTGTTMANSVGVPL